MSNNYLYLNGHIFVIWFSPLAGRSEIIKSDFLGQISSVLPLNMNLTDGIFYRIKKAGLSGASPWLPWHQTPWRDGFGLAKSPWRGALDWPNQTGKQHGR